MIKNILNFFTRREHILFHLESPGVRVRITRSKFEDIFKPDDFATLRECIRAYNQRY
mgnify:CR=1 FL=1